MARKSSHLSLSIPGDELENHRIQLEHDLQNTDLSLHLSSLPDEREDENESIEYPRHNSAPSPFPGFASFGQRENLDDPDDYSHLHAWSMREDEGIGPYDARTLSTVAHHASGVTITAGLRRGSRREASTSGAEYDPERRVSMLAHEFAGNDTSMSQDISRPKLSETLQRVGFSPRRPRSVQTRLAQEGGVQRRVTAPSVSPGTHRSIAKDNMSRSGTDTDLGHINRPSRKSARARVHLPDITGLTNAVISPAKGNLDRHGIRVQASKEVEARLVNSLNTLHIRLAHLESENSIARRRVRELEYELEQCKRDVVKERTRIMESQDAPDITMRPVGPSTSRTKGKEKKVRDADQQSSKYFEIVEEKKALEALISTLRSHLTRVTSDLSSQQQLLEELRRLRESDALSLSEKVREIDQLRTEVERLSGEIEVLRGVVEEGLNERRQVRTSPDEGERSSSNVEVALPMESIVSRPPTPAPSLRRSAAKNPENSRTPSSVAISPSDSVGRFVDQEELKRISADLDERRSERSSSASRSEGDSSLDGLLVACAPGVGEPVQPQDRKEEPQCYTASPVPSCTSRSSKVRAEGRSQIQQVDSNSDDDADLSPPFPRISSERLERLFFSAPRHNANGCRTCKGCQSHCHRDIAREKNVPRATRRIVRSKQREEDQGLGGDINIDARPTAPSGEEVHVVEDILERIDRSGGIFIFKPGEVPPQTVLARVLRELEDEFTHSKEIYNSLAEQYKSMHATTQPTKRNIVADQLLDVIDTIERKGDQITSLYELLVFKDKPI
ncbi:hypothetical protein F5I97DRAFT_1882568 [Phlebopus sp. FC_14]|nr:hypothetical protein F5I97DRAFT_1882568 [Phlebopus sp. FC_14]